jgi:hypothetical protein
MKTSRNILVLSILIVFILSILSNQFSQAAASPQSPAEAEKLQILSATVQLLVFPPEGIEYERGIGTLFRYGSGTFILTHNHWSMLTISAKVEFRNEKNQLLLAISGAEFLELVDYRDRGSIIIKAPSALPSQGAVTISDFPQLTEGEQLTLVHRNSRDHNQLDIMTVKVIRVLTDKGTSAFNIIPLNQAEIIPGDSGGGLWHEGQLAGNMWAFYPETQPGFLNLTRPDESQIGIVAQLPFDYLQTYQGLTPHHSIADVQDGKDRDEP